MPAKFTLVLNGRVAIACAVVAVLALLLTVYVVGRGDRNGSVPEGVSGELPREGAFKSAGRAVEGAFAQTRRFAVTGGVTHFLVFMNVSGGGFDGPLETDRGRMEIHRDMNRNDTYDAPTDLVVGEPRMPAMGFRFALSAGVPQREPAWLAFLKDGSIRTGSMIADVPSDRFDAMLSTPSSSPSVADSDLAIEQAGQCGRLFIDFEAPTGKFRRMEYRE